MTGRQRSSNQRPQPHSRTTAVLWDELYPGCLKRRTDGEERVRPDTVLLVFEIHDRSGVKASIHRESFDADTQKVPGGAAALTG